MLLDNVRVFCDRGDKYMETFGRYLKIEVDSVEKEPSGLLESLSQLLMEPKCAKDVMECFPQYILVLLSQAIPIDSSRVTAVTGNGAHRHRLNCVVLGNLISSHPDVLGFALRYFELNPAPFASIVDNLAALPKRARPSDVVFVGRDVTNLEIVTATYNILEAAPEHFRSKWKWSEFYEFLMDKDDTVKWIALKCLGVVLQMSESTRLACAQTLLKDAEKFLVDYREEICTGILTSEIDDTEELSNIAKNLDSVVSIAGVLLPVFDGKNRSELKNSNLVSVASMESNLRSLALAVASRRCVCLEGSVGCGKTALVEYLAEITGHGGSNFLKVQLGDQTDSKMLLGTYRCTDIPGEFLWQPGVLTQAVLEGKWLLLEDIDSAALDVASVLGNLMETGTLTVPGYRDTIYAKSGFQLFLTQRLVSTSHGLHRRSAGASNLLAKHWFSVHVDALTRDELVSVVKTLFPALTTSATRMVDVFLLFSMGNHENTSENLIRTGRLISTRDLMKWCTRAIVDFQVSSPDSLIKIFQDAIDIFCCSVADRAQRLELATAIGHTLGIVRTKAEYFSETHKPQINLLSDVFIAGRAKLLRKKQDFVRMEKEKVKFSFTRPSAVLLERVASCVAQREPVLLVGETGTGKTSSIQYLAKSTGHKLVVINMNQQSESADLLGGYKPVDFKHLITPTREEFEMLFRAYFAVEPNREFLKHIATSYADDKWTTLVTLMHHSAGAAVKRLRNQVTDKEKGEENSEDGKLAEKRKISRISDDKSCEGGEMKSLRSKSMEMLEKWEKLLAKLEKLKNQVKTNYSLAFAFLEGSLIKALQEGHWVLLDEINLASSETLECLSGLLEGSTGSVSLLERGDSESVKRHPDFTIFACMNPATDVGKKELPVGLRNRFTEFWIDELTEKSDLQLLVNSYLADVNLPTSQQESIVKFYLNVRKEALLSLNDGTGHKPHYSLRTLCRALTVASSNPCGNLQRSLYEAFSLSFLTQLDHKSYPVVQAMISRAILEPKIAKAILSSQIPRPQTNPENYINFEGYWVIRGDLEPRVPENYILTKSVRRNLRDLVRIVSIGKIPVLLQGDTSVGKTSLITYLAKASGHTCVRINNHEHTDLQEYVGSYVADETGKLVFKEGVLVEAMRRGHWIILDELNLAPSDVLEALNRVLDDNRELFIPETQRVVKAHANFMLFATQNPPGLYGGRKVLSRAFRNRFVELHFDEIPSEELQIILHERCHMPESYCKQIIGAMTDLQLRRKSTSTFQGKHGFITLRDLFRWGERYRLAPDISDGKLYDWSQHLADEGYLVLAAKVRKIEETREIRDVLKQRLKRDVDPANLFTLHDKTSAVTRGILEEILSTKSRGFDHVVWTYHMRRMAVLVRKSCQFDEPVLLVGETGGGKTTICQLIAAMSNQNLHGVNCHMHTESSDFLGNLRPVRDHTDAKSQKLFEWVDGPLITAMRNGDLFLADEISLADDSVLERLNSLLEPERSLLLAEKSVDSVDSNKFDCTITAHEKFHFIGTMNPGGDYGKKELSPALRNRFTEIWCEGCVDKDDLRAIVKHNLHSENSGNRDIIATLMLDFVDWLKESEVGKHFTVSIRDILTWVNFINSCTGENQDTKLSLADAYLHGACLTYIDSLGSGLTGMESAEKLTAFRKNALAYLETQVNSELGGARDASLQKIDETGDAVSSATTFGITPFFIAKGSAARDRDDMFTFAAPTTRSNTLKLLRALQLKKPLLLEGSPGVGKTSLVAALARASGHALLRINLSDQTDVSDLFGADLPLEGGRGGQFAWKDGPFLRALRAGDWILLDELNLASQSVLEGLNACLDHRGEIYVPELGRTFTVKPATKLFGCQNPLRQGGARRGLPKSFLNRFTQVYVDALTDGDLKLIVGNQFPQISAESIDKIVNFNSKLSREVGVAWAHDGSPWEMNLRDITRWCEAIVAAKPDHLMNGQFSYNPGNAVELIYVDRMRTQNDRSKVRELYAEMFSIDQHPLTARQPLAHVTKDAIYFGDVRVPREEYSSSNGHDLLLLRDQIPVLRSLARCVQMNWMPILVGGPGCGKSSVVRVLAQLTGQRLRTIVVNSAMDTTEILGGFEQTDYNRHLEKLLEEVEGILIESLKRRLKCDDGFKQIVEYHSWLERIQNLSHDESHSTTMAAETKLFRNRTKELWKLVNAMKSLQDVPCSKLEFIEDELVKLGINVKQDKCLNAGGKFEWVDSILVKCLQEGSWLMLDQVNLCSPAVLDRLNGLLEPGGVLTIGERGVANDGNILTIKPHKNFRLFLTMDPRFGEISRAMRNRGVEIYMLGHKENCNNDILDLRSMLHNLGITRSNHQAALLEIHEKIAAEDLTADKLSLVHLLHSAFLINQQTSRGFSVKEAFRTSCNDVYVKSRCLQQSGTRDRLRVFIDDSITHHDIDHPSEIFFDLGAVTPKIHDFQDNSKLAIVRQQGFLICSAFQIYQSEMREKAKKDDFCRTSSFINDFLAIPNSREISRDVNIEEILPYLLLSFYESCSANDAELRKRWLDSILPRNMCGETLGKFKKINDSLAREIAASKRELPAETLPWDMANLPNFTDNENRLGRANRLALILYLITMNIQYDEILGDMNLDKDAKMISLMQYSSSVYQGNLTSHLVNQPLVTNFVIFIAQLYSCLDLLFRNNETLLSSQDYTKFRREFSWLVRFYNLGKLPLIDKTEKATDIYGDRLDEIVLMLRVHYKWLLKFTGSVFAVDEKFGKSDECRIELSKLAVMIEDIDDSLKSVNDPFRKITKRMKKYIVTPLPFASEITITIYEQLKKLSEQLVPFARDRKEISLKRDLKTILLQNTETMENRCRLIELWTRFYANKDFSDNVEEILREIEEFCARSNLGLRTPVETSKALEQIQIYSERDIVDLSAQVQLWPIYEYIFFILVNNLQRKICDNEAIDTKALDKLSKIPSIPIALVGLLKALAEIRTIERDRAKPEIFTGLDRFVRNSNAFHDSTEMLHWQGISESDVEKSITSQEKSESNNPLYCPILVSTVCELIVNKSQSVHERSILATASLGAYRSRLRQFKTLNELLWRNSVSLNSRDYENSKNDRSTLVSCSKVFLEAEEKMSAAKGSRTIVYEEIEKLNGAKRIELEEKFARDYVEPLNELRETVDEISSCEPVNNDAIARSWILLGYLQVFLFGNLGHIDPIHKIGLKLRYIEEDIEDLRKTIYVADLNARIRGDEYPSDNTNPRVIEIAECLLALEKDRDNLKICKAIRPSSLEFVALAKETSNFRSTLGSWEIVTKLTKKLSESIDHLRESAGGLELSRANDGIQESEMWLESLQQFSELLDRRFTKGYPDIVIPLVTAVSQLRRGVICLRDETSRLLSLRKSNDSGKFVESLMHNIVRFPTIGRGQKDLLCLVETCTSKETREIIDKYVKIECADKTFVSLTEQFRMVKNGLAELYNHISLGGKLEKRLWDELNALLQQIVLIWQRQRDENAKREAEKDSLYKNKAKIHGDSGNDEAEIARELGDLFPTSRDEDFEDIEEIDRPTLEQVENEAEENNSLDRRYAGLVTDEDMSQVHEIHTRIVTHFVRAPWIRRKFLESDGRRDYIGPLVERYSTFSRILENVLPAMDRRLDTKLYTSLTLMTAVTLRTSDGHPNDRPDDKITRIGSNAREKSYDYYRSSNVEEAKQCLSILEAIVNRVEGFLKEWPEHPTLRSIKMIINRIYGFSITSPISRFLTGLELLLVKMKEWEENAHSGVSLSELSYTLTQQIISWRRLELASWKDCLSTAEERLRSKASKWWFFLYALIEAYMTQSALGEMDVPRKDASMEAPKIDEPITGKKLTELLESFISGSSIIEFKARLDLLMIFHLHAFCLTKSSERDQLSAILWNVHKYYSQFISDVDKKMKSLKAPIEKKLRDFVKIARWNDINYWSVKETVEKTHRTLHKLIREYEVGLKTSVVTCLLLKSSSYGSESEKGEWDRPKDRDYTIDPKDFVDSGKILIPTDRQSKDIPEGTELVSRMESLLSKAKRLSKETILMTSYPGLRVGFEQFVETMISHASRLKNMDIDRTLEKNKQKSHAKSILQQKKMTLANYFKTLSHIGLSYRTGTLAWKNRQSQIIDLTVPPVDIQAALERLKPHGKADKQLLAQWDGCENYYYKSLIELNALHTAFNSKQTDLGSANMERCSGYSVHMMLMAHKQKRLLASSFENYISIRRHVSNLSQIAIDSTGNDIVSDHECRDCSSALRSLIGTLQTGFEQLEIYLEACPSDPGLVIDDEVLRLESSHLDILNASRSNSTWESAKSILQQSQASLKWIVETHDKLFYYNTLVIGPTHYKFLNASYTILANIKDKIGDFAKVFSNATETSHPILDTIQFLDSEIDEWIQQFLLMDVSENSIDESASSSVDETTSAHVEQLIKTILLAIQQKYKETLTEEESEVPEINKKENEESSAKKDTDREEAENDEEDDTLVENGLREKLIESLEKDFNSLRLDEVHAYLVKLLTMTSKENTSLAFRQKSFIIRCLPLLRQYLLFSQFYLIEQVGALRATCKFLHLQLSVFIDLATNGFCVPKDLDLEEGDGEESKEGKSQNGMGLGDGEGEKDVSDRIESEDQLEDARPADQEKEKNEDNDCKEEENGIEMSEDFDGKLQDLDKNEDDEKEEQSGKDDDDLDKEMGDTEKGADALDEEIWGDDKDESSTENENDQNENDQGKGQETGEKEMTAKDDSKNDKDDHEKNDEDGERKEEEKKEINEMNEPEINDDQINPYHGNLEPPPEPEPMDLPDELNLDGEDADDNPQGDQDNPFDIDEMKECVEPPEKEEIPEGEEEKKDDAEPGEDSSDEEDDSKEDPNTKSLDQAPAEDEQSQPEAESDPKNLPGDKVDEDEEKKEEDKKEDTEQEDKAAPSFDDPSKEMDAADQPDVDNGDGSHDKVAEQQNANDEQQTSAENNEDNSNNKGTGNAQSEQQDSGHSGASMQNTAPVQHSENEQKQMEKRKNPGESDENRTLVDNIQPEKKKMKMIHSQEEQSKDNEEEGAEINEDKNETDECQHVSKSDKYDDRAMDAATKEQVKQQAVNQEDEEEKIPEGESMEVEMNADDEENIEDEQPAEQNSEKTQVVEKDMEKRKNDSKGNNIEDAQMESAVEVEGDVTETLRVDRGIESNFFTNIPDFNEAPLTSAQVADKRMEVEAMLSQWTYVPSSLEALTAWNCLNNVVEGPARDLAEKLRLVLEPTQATRLRGDYRTGRRINMRKIIPYIASQFKKDKIWLRRTKPSKRDYQIVLAIDDSSSMADNHSKELAFESLSLISKAMGYLEVGELSVMSFGESTTVLHPLGQPFTENSGSRLIQEMRFDQKKTKVGQLVDFTVDMFDSQRSSTDSAKLLVVLSDGRGVFSEGQDHVNAAVRRARLADIFLVFIIVDNPLNKDSILDIRMPVFQAGKLLGIKSYMDSFPFPFYMILRDINALPGVLSDALRQWFEVVGKIDT